jgi:branched-chain amino acid transport system permease protein
MSDLLQYLVSGAALGAVYALVALGFVVIYRASEVFNFAHGELLTLGALITVSLSAPPRGAEDAFSLGAQSAVGLGLPFALAVVLAMFATGGVAGAIERVVLRPLVGRPVFVSIILTLFIGILLRTAMVLAWGTEPLPLATPWDSAAPIELGEAVLDLGSIAAIAAGVAALAAFSALLRFTRIGLAMRASQRDQETALALGVPVGRILGFTWFFAGALAALAGVFLGVREPSIGPNLGFIALRAFPAVIVGGLESAFGAVLAGLFLGIVEVLTAGYVNPALGPLGRNLHAVLPYLNAGLEAAGGSPLDAAVLDRAWENLEITWEPLGSTLEESAQHAVDAGTSEELVDLAGIYDLRPLNAILTDLDLDAVSAAGLGEE